MLAPLRTEGPVHTQCRAKTLNGLGSRCSVWFTHPVKLQKGQSAETKVVRLCARHRKMAVHWTGVCLAPDRTWWWMEGRAPR